MLGRSRRRRPAAADTPDAFEQAAARLDADRRSRELGDPIPLVPPDVAAPLPSRRQMRRVLLLVAAAVLVLALGRLAGRSGTPSLPASCTSYRLALAPATVRAGGGVSWSATGPSGTPVSVVVDGRVVSRPGTALVRCRSTGRFVVPPGDASREVQLTDSRTGAVRATSRLGVTG